MTEPTIHTLSIPNLFMEGRNRVYVIAEDPVTMIDTGIATGRAFDAIVAGLAGVGMAVTDIQRVVLTHKHIDHIGNAWRFQQASGAEILIHESEAIAVRDVDPGGDRFRALVTERMVEWDVPEELRPSQAPSSFSMRWELESAEATPLREGDRIPMGAGALEVLHTPGHTLGSICLKYGRTLFSGDHVLPQISPNVGGGDMRNNGLLRHYLSSLEKMIATTENDPLQVLPGHGDAFSHLRARCEELIAHHRDRLELAERILDDEGPRSVYEMAGRLFGEMKDFHVVLGCAEAAAHLEHLEQEGRVVRENGAYRRA